MPFPWIRSARKVRHLEDRVRMLADDLEAIKSRFDVPDELAAEFRLARETEEYRAPYARHEPLVSVCVATYHKPDALIERCLASLLAQTYRNLEIIVVGDCCTDETSARMAAIRDPRVHYENLPARTPYPEEPELRWMVAGTPAMNRGLELARGDFITHLDHDDRHDPARVERLVSFIQKTQADLVHHPFHYEPLRRDGWDLQEARSFRLGHVTTSSVLYHRWLARIRWDLFSYRFREPGDWGRFRRMHHL
jgi:glycosyltransferase involved in cell wall biosynthesis